MATTAAASSSFSGGSSTKGKSSKRSLSHAENDSVRSSSKSRNASLVEDTPSSKKRKSNVQNNGTPTIKIEPSLIIKEEKSGGELLTLDWTTDDLTTLIHKLGSQVPKVDKGGKYSTALEKVDWNDVRFGNHDEAECKQKWIQIMCKVRRFRTLTELVDEAKEWVKHPWLNSTSKTKTKHPNLPKKPLTPYFRYFLERRAKASKEHPTMSMTDLAKFLAAKYSALPEKKKMKYRTSYNQENEEYKVVMAKLKLEHPEMFATNHRSAGKSSSKQNIGGPPKPHTPMQLFMAEKMTKHTNLDPAEKKEYEEKYREQWRNISNTKRVKWIKKAIQGEEQYALDLAQYCIDNPEFKPETPKSIITKAEKQILDDCSGKPQKPPNSGYSLYSKIMLKQIKDIPSKEKMAEISRRWKDLTEIEKNSYAEQVVDATEKYQKDYAAYLENLTEDERNKLEDVKIRKKPISGNKKATQEKSNEEVREQGNARPKKPMSALFLYTQEKLPGFRAKHPEKSEQEITRHLVREFGDLSEKKKEKYKKMAEEAKKSIVISPVKVEGRKSKLFKGEPKKPPQSGYLLFTTELIKKLVTIEPKQRMAEISLQWRSLSPSDQEVYKKKAASLLKKYNKDLQKFISGLSADDRILYDQTRSKKGGGGANAMKAATTSPVKKAKPTTVPVNVADSSNDADSDKDDNESSNGSGSRSDDSSDDESDRSESGSDSRSDSDSSNSSDSDNTNDSSGSSSDDDSNEESGSDSESGSGSDK